MPDEQAPMDVLILATAAVVLRNTPIKADNDEPEAGPVRFRSLASPVVAHGLPESFDPLHLKEFGRIPNRRMRSVKVVSVD